MKIYGNVDLQNTNKIINSDAPSGSTDLPRLSELTSGITIIENNAILSNAELGKQIKATIKELEFVELYESTVIDRNWKKVTSCEEVSLAITKGGKSTYSTDYGSTWKEQMTVTNTWTGLTSFDANYPNYEPIPITIELPTTGQTVVGVRIKDININHTWDGDVLVKLTSPNGRDVSMWSNIGSVSDNFRNTSLDDDALIFVYESSAPFTGTFKPTEPFSNFVGDDVNGTWILNVSDNGGGDICHVLSWTIEIDYKPTKELNDDDEEDIYNSVCCGDGIFIAVGNSGKTMNSRNNGNIWSNIDIESGETYTFSDIVYGDEIFVATLTNVQNSGGSIFTTIDGVEWIKRTGDINNIAGQWDSITYCNGTFFAISSNNYFMSSTDGITWTEPIQNIFIGAKYISCGIDKIVVISETGNTIGVSEDNGLTFTMSELSYSYTSSNICFGDDRFVIACSDAETGNFVIESFDGYIYTKIDNTPDKQYTDITYNSFNFVAIHEGETFTILPKRESFRLDEIEDSIVSVDNTYNTNKTTYTTIDDIGGEPNNISFNNVNVGTSGYLIDISFPTPGIGYTVSIDSSGSVFKTIDSGATWVEQSTGQAQVFRDVYFVDENIGYVCGYNGTIIKTEDGGNTWSGQTSTITGRIWAINFATAEIGYASCDGGVILKTVNGGTTWVQLSTPFSSYIWNLFVFNEDIIYIGGNAGDFAKSIDGGQTFTSYTTGVSTIRGINFTSENVGYITDSSRMIHGTTDGGQTFTPLHLSNGNMYNISTVGNDYIYAVGDTGTFIKSEDAGKTWSETSIDGDQLYGVEFITPDIGYVCGASGVFKTTNATNKIISDKIILSGGWEAKYMNGLERWSPSDHYGVLPVYFYNKDIGFYTQNAGDNKVYKTINGGTDWNFLYEPSGNTILDFQFLSEDNGWACGTNGLVYKTNDGGITWEIFETGSSSTLLKMFVLDENRLWFVGNSFGFRTEDGCASFSGMTNVGHAPQDIEFTENGVGYCGFSNNAFFNLRKSTDSGNTWTTIWANGTADINGMSIIDDDNLIICVGTSILGSSNNVIYKIENAGSPEQIVRNVFQHNKRNRNLIRNNNQVWVSSVSRILYSDDTGETWTMQYYNSDIEEELLLVYGKDDDAICLTTSAYKSDIRNSYVTSNKGVHPATYFEIDLFSGEMNDILSGQTILLKDQNITPLNGIYDITSVTTNDYFNTSIDHKIVLSRSTKLNNYDESSFTYIQKGDLYKNCGFIQTSNIEEIGVSNITWSQMTSPDYINVINTLQSKIEELSGSTTTTENNIIILSGETSITGITLTKNYAIIDVIDELNDSVLISKSYNDDGSEVDLDFGIPFYGKVIIQQ